MTPMISRIRMTFTTAIVTAAIACSGDKTADTADTGLAATAAESSAGDAQVSEEAAVPLTLTAADLDGFEKGIARETQLVKEAQERSRTATTPQARGEAIQATFEDNTISAAAPVTGLSPERYKLVRETLSKIMTTLDFQGKIDGPQSVDTARAGPDMKARLSSDPYAALDPAGAEALKARLDRITPVWVDYDGEFVLVNSKVGRTKNANVLNRPHVAIEISDPDNPYRYLMIRGVVVEVITQPDTTHIDSLSQRYIGVEKYPWGTPGEVRQILKIRPEHVVARVVVADPNKPLEY